MKLPVFPILTTILAASLVLAACQPVGSQAQAIEATLPILEETFTAGQAQTVEALVATAVVPTLTPVPPTRIWLPPYLPDTLRSELTLPAEWETADQESGADYALDILLEPSAHAAGTSWVYALAAPFATITDDVALEDLTARWRGGESNTLNDLILLVDESTLAIFTRLWGEPGEAVRVTPVERLLADAASVKNAWAILPFDQLEPRWKVIAIDGQSPVQKSFQAEPYPLAALFGVMDAEGEPVSGESAPVSLPPSNRQTDHLTTVMLTGVTALVRGTASLMEVLGMDYPATDIGDTLREADILHINNEAVFASDCPHPYPWEGLAFCSQTEYIALLESIGTDVIEFSGDHLQDWGVEATSLTLDLYEERGWPIYGGGRNSAEAQVPVYFEHNGNRIAFLGCSAKEEGYSGAGVDSPGSIHCDFDQLVAEIGRVRSEGYLPLVTFQHLEYLRYDIHPALQADFRRVAEAGAVIVSGSQAHQPHAMEFYPAPGASGETQGSASFLHYGLGNLFFDQLKEGYPNRQAFIDRHVFYEGRHISTELITILFIDYARARPMTVEERQDLLSTVFKASGW
jgi:poly-gamma-glutamate synthesis protein (capsule biosynthesis protein)